MRTYIHSPANVASVRKRVPRRRPHRQLAIAAPTAGAEKAPPCVSARWDISPTFGLGEGHGSLDVLVGMNRTRHLAYELQQSTSILVLRANLENTAVTVKREEEFS